MRLVFLGTPPEAAVALRALVEAGHDVPLVVTQPDRRRGRGGAAAPSPVKVAAADLDLAVETPERAGDILDRIRSTGAELGVVVAFGQILKPDVLDALPAGFVNVHYSLLPRWRGAAPVERAILAGDAETGVCIMRMEEGLDTGPVFHTERLAIDERETAGELRARLATLGARVLVDAMKRFHDLTAAPQVGEPTYAKKLDPAEFELQWPEPAEALARRVRAGNPHPGAWTTASGQRLKVLRAHPASQADDGSPGTLVDLPEGPAVRTGAGLLVLDQVQMEGKRVGDAAAWRRGARHVEALGR